MTLRRLALILSVLLAVPALGQTTRPATRPSGPATQPATLYVTHPDKAKVWVCTDPATLRGLHSEIPPDVLQDYSVADLTITTNWPRDRWGEAFDLARRRGGYLLLDEELQPTGLDVYKGNLKLWQANMEACAEALHEVHQQAPDLRVYFYPKTPPRHGIARSWPRQATDKPYFTQRDYFEVARAERKAFRVAGPLLEAYTYDATGRDEDTFVTWADNLDYMALQAEAQGVGGQRLCLISPWKMDEQRNEWVQSSDALWERQLRHVLAEGYRPVLWNPQDAGWAVVKRVLGH